MNSSRSGHRRAVDRRPLLARRARLRADLQGVGGVQFRPGRDVPVRGAGARAADRGDAGGAGAGRGGARSWWRSPSRSSGWCCGRWSTRTGSILFMATIGITFFITGFGQALFGSDVYTLDLGIPKTPLILFERIGSRRYSGQRVRPVGRGDGRGPRRRARRVLPAHPDRPRAARRRRRPPGGAVGRHPAAAHLGHRLGAWPGLSRSSPGSSGARSSGCSSRSRSSR